MSSFVPWRAEFVVRIQHSSTYLDYSVTNGTWLWCALLTDILLHWSATVCTVRDCSFPLLLLAHASYESFYIFIRARVACLAWIGTSVYHYFCPNFEKLLDASSGLFYLYAPGHCLGENFYVRGDGTRCYFFKQGKCLNLIGQYTVTSHVQDFWGMLDIFLVVLVLEWESVICFYFTSVFFTTPLMALFGTSAAWNLLFQQYVNCSWQNIMLFLLFLFCVLCTFRWAARAVHPCGTWKGSKCCRSPLASQSRSPATNVSCVDTV